MAAAKGDGLPTGYLAMKSPPLGYPKEFRTKNESSAWHPLGAGCCRALSPDKSVYCTYPAWLPHENHEGYTWFGLHHDAPIVGELTGSKPQVTWRNDKFLVRVETDWPGEEDLLLPNASANDHRLMTIQQLDRLDHIRLTGLEPRETPF